MISILPLQTMSSDDKIAQPEGQSRQGHMEGCGKGGGGGETGHRREGGGGGGCEDSFSNDLGNSSESWFPWKPGNSDFILFLKQPRNILEIWFLGFLGNSETIPFLNDLGTLWKSSFLDFSDSLETQKPKHGN